jgi:flagellar motor switch protein FliN/FliY
MDDIDEVSGEDDSIAEFKESLTIGDDEKGLVSKLSKEMDQFLDIPLEVSVDLGRTRMSIRQMLQLSPNSVLELNKLVGEPMEIHINNVLIARGEVVVVNERFGIRVTDVIDPLEVERGII